MGISIEQQAERTRARLMVSAEVARKTSEACLDSIILAAEIISTSFRAGGKFLLCGNGGSAADAQHIAAEFIGKFNFFLCFKFRYGNFCSKKCTTW